MAARRMMLRPLLLAALVAFGFLAVRAAREATVAGGSADPARRARAIHEAQRYEPVLPGKPDDEPTGPSEIRGLLAEGDPELAARTLREAIALAPQWAIYHYALGLAEIELGDLGEARYQFEQARRFGPSHSGLLLAMGSVWIQTARVREDPELAVYSFPLFAGAARLESGNLRPAIDALRPLVVDLARLAAIVPDVPLCHRDFGLLLLAEKRPELAVPHLEAAAADRALRDSALYLALGRSRLRTGDLEGARREFERALSLSIDPDATVRGLYADYADRPEEGLAFWNALVVRYARGARFNLGRLAFQAGPDRYEAAHEQFRLVDGFGGDAATTSYLARIEIRWKDYQTAEQRLSRALFRFGETADLRYLHSQALHGLGREQEAVLELERSIELAPANAAYRDLLLEWMKH